MSSASLTVRHDRNHGDETNAVALTNSFMRSNSEDHPSEISVELVQVPEYEEHQENDDIQTEIEVLTEQENEASLHSVAKPKRKVLKSNWWNVLWGLITLFVCFVWDHEFCFYRFG